VLMKRLAMTSGMGVSVEGQQQDGSGALYSELFGERTGAVRRLVRVITGWLETVEYRFDPLPAVRYAVLIQGGEQALTRHLVGCQFDCGLTEMFLDVLIAPVQAGNEAGGGIEVAGHLLLVRLEAQLQAFQLGLGTGGGSTVQERCQWRYYDALDKAHRQGNHGCNPEGFACIHLGYLVESCHVMLLHRPGLLLR